MKPYGLSFFEGILITNSITYCEYIEIFCFFHDSVLVNCVSRNFSILSKLSMFSGIQVFLWHFFIIFKMSVGLVVMSPFSFLILVIYVICLFLLTSGEKEFPTVLIFSKNQLLFHWFIILIFMLSITWMIFTLILILFFFPPAWSLICFHLSTVLRWKHKLLFWDLFYFLI